MKKLLASLMLLFFPVVVSAMLKMPQLPYDAIGEIRICPKKYDVPTFITYFSSEKYMAFKIYGKVVIYVQKNPYKVYISYDGENVDEVYNSMLSVKSVYPDVCAALETIYPKVKEAI